MQQAMRVQGGTPLAVLHVGLAPRQVTHLTAVDHQHFQSGSFQHSIEWQPIHARGFHRHRAHLMRQQPVAQRVQLRSDGAEHFRRPAGNRHEHLFAADIDKCSVRIQHSQVIHLPPPVRVKMAMSCHKPGRVLGMTNLSNGKQQRSPKCAVVRNQSQSVYRAAERTKRKAATLFVAKPASATLPGSRSVRSFGRNRRL